MINLTIMINEIFRKASLGNIHSKEKKKNIYMIKDSYNFYYTEYWNSEKHPDLNLTVIKFFFYFILTNFSKYFK